MDFIIIIIIVNIKITIKSINIIINMRASEHIRRNILSVLYYICTLEYEVDVHLFCQLNILY